MNGKVTYRQQYTRCGKQRCRKCKEGAGHGPYWYAYWSENGRTISKYIGIHPPEEIAAKEQPGFVTSEEINALAATDNTPSSQKTIPLPHGVDETITGETKRHQAKILPDVTGSQPLVRVYLLGHFRVERKEGDEWQTVANRTWQRRRARALLGCLLSQTGRRMGREQVMEALWPELDVETAANRLNGAVHELRQILEPEIERPAASKLLRLERDILMLADTAQIWVDAEAFETLLNQINITKDQALVEQMLEQAWELYEGDYLLEELYSEWAAARREALRRGWMGLLLNLARLRAERGALTSAIEPLDRLLTADPTHETAVRRLMVLLTQLDRRGEAIRAYQRLATILKRDYESDPLPETVDLYKALRQGQLQALLPLNDSLAEARFTRPSGRHSLEKSSSTLSHPLARTPDKAAIPDNSSAQALNTSSTQQLPRPASPPGRHNLSPLIGRERELEAVHELLLAINELSPHDERKKTNSAEHRPRLAHCVMILGETGIGKTRLAEELSQQAHTLGWRVAWTRSYEQEGTIPYRPWTDILRTLLQDIPMEQLITMIEGKNGQAEGEAPGALNPAATTQAKLTRLSSLLPELVTAQELLQQAHPHTPVAPEQERFHLWEAMLSLLNALAQSAPLLLVLDDLHWTDDSSLELLAYLARHQQNERIMLVGTCRDIELAPSSSLRSLLNDLRREQVLVTFPLQPLTQAQIARLVAHLPHELVRSIQSQAGGNPLFAEELARLNEATSIPLKPYDKNSPSYAGQSSAQILATNNANDSGPTPMPETIAAVLERRLNKLGESCQALLSKAAVLGRSFEFSLLVRMTGEVGSNEDTTLDLLEEALRSGLLTEEVNGTRIVYHFWHPLIVSHLYERLSAARRAQLHRKAAQALIELHIGNEAKGATAIAHHLSKYGQDKQKLAYYTEIAGNQAMALSAYPEALHYYRLALESLQTLNTSTPHAEQDALHIANFLECMAECNYMLGNAADARQQYTQALELHKSQQKDASMFPTSEAFRSWQKEEAQVQGMLWRSIGRVWKYIGEFGQAHDCAQRGKEVLRAAGITTGAAWACLEHLDGSTCWAEGNFSEARYYVEKSLQIHEEMRRKVQGNADGEYTGLIVQQDMLAPLITHSRRVLLGDPLELGRTHESLGVIAASMAQYTEALQHLHTALTIFENHDRVGVMSQVCSNIGAVHSMRSEYTVATTYFKRALELGERTGDRRIKPLVTGNLGDIAARNGNLQEAATWLNESVALADQISDREHSSWSMVTLAFVQQDMGDMRTALETIRHALAEGRNIKSTTRVGFALVALAHWRVTRAFFLSQQNASPPLIDGRVNRAHPECLRLLHSARAAIERALHLTGIDIETECMGQVVLTAIYYHLGELEEARHQARKALEETHLSELMYLIGRAQRLQGEIQVASGLEQEADASFEQALQTCKEHGLRLDYARTLHRYGNSLLARSLHVKSARGASSPSNASIARAGLDYLREARAIFVTCQASLDLQWVEETLTNPAFLSNEN